MRYVEITSRNVYITPQHQKILSQLLKKAQNEFVKKWINTIFSKYLINDYKFVGNITKRNNTFYAGKHKITNPPNWLTQDVLYLEFNALDNIRWLHWIDYLNTLPARSISIPVKDIEKKITEWEQTFSSSKEDGITLLHKYPDKFCWVKVFGKDSLNREGKLMNHCVGSYYNQVKDEKCEIYSLRDGNKKPHVTIEYYLPDKEISQIKGHSNSVPSKYIKYINHFLQKKLVPWKTLDQDELHRVGLLYQDKIYEIEKLPQGFMYYSDLDLSAAQVTNLGGLKRVYGDLDLSESKVTQLPDNLVVDGYLDISYTGIHKLPKKLLCNELYIQRTPLTSLPKDLVVQSLYINENFLSVEEIQKRLKNVRISTGTKYDSSGLSCARIKQYFEDGKKISIQIENEVIKDLPSNLKVDGPIYFKDCHIKEWPKNLYGNNNLDILNCILDTPMSEFHVDGVVTMQSIIKSDIILPKTLKATKLVIKSNNIIFPPNFYFNGDLDITELKNLHLPPMNITGNTIINFTQPLSNYVVHGNLVVEALTYLIDDRRFTFSKDLVVKGDVILKRKSLLEMMPPDIKVGGKVIVNKSTPPA